MIKTIGIWYVFVIHIPTLRLLGPRISLALSRVTAHVHWFACCLGAEKQVRTSMDLALPVMQPGLRTTTAMRRYLVNKHQQFVEWYVFPFARARRHVWERFAEVEGLQHLDDSLAEGKGVIVLVFHFGLALSVCPALKVCGYEPALHVFRGATYAASTTLGVARMVVERQVRLERASGLRTIYHRPMFAFETLRRFLADNGMLGMNADGMMGSDFADLDFFDGRITLPRGPARLAAVSGAPIVPAFAQIQGARERRLVLHEPIRCEADTPEAVTRCMQRYVVVFEDYARRSPWDWWTWRRLDLTKREGILHFRARGLDPDAGLHHETRTAEGSDCAGTPATAGEDG